MFCKIYFLYFVKYILVVCKTGRTFSTSSCPLPHSPSQTSISCNNGKLCSQENLRKQQKNKQNGKGKWPTKDLF